MFKKIFYILFLVIAVWLLFQLKVLYIDIPALKAENPKNTAFMRAAGRQKLSSWTPLRKISKNIQKAVLLSEDASFYNHEGFDYDEMWNAVKTNIEHKSYVRGASTISMQLSKNLFLSPNKAIHRKLLEAVYTWKLEKDLSKKRILEIYLNVIEWGKGKYGIREASRHYFKKEPHSLTNREAAFLASIIPNPRIYGKWPPNFAVKKKMNRLLRYLPSTKSSSSKKVAKRKTSKSAQSANQNNKKAEDKAKKEEAEMRIPESIFLNALDPE